MEEVHPKPTHEDLLLEIDRNGNLISCDRCQDDKSYIVHHNVNFDPILSNVIAYLQCSKCQAIRTLKLKQKITPDD